MTIHLLKDKGTPLARQRFTWFAENAGEEKLAAAFEQALTEEQEHLALMRRWVAAAQGRSPEP